MSERKVVLILESLSAAAAEESLASRPLPADIGKPQFRRMAAAAERAMAESGYDAATHTVTLTISSEFPVERWDGSEILLHGKKNIDTSRLEQGISHLYNHNWDILLGRTTGYEITDKKLQVSSKWGTNDDAKKREQDMADGILPDVSLGYMIDEVEVTEDKNGVRTYNVVRWMPYEWSSVTVPADFSVGLDRAAQLTTDVRVRFRKLDDDPTPPAAERKADAEDEDDEEDEDEDGERSAEKPQERAADVDPAPPATSSAPPTDSSTTQPTQRTQPIMPPAEVTTDQSQNIERVNGIRALRAANPALLTEAQAFDAITNGTSVEAVRSAMLDASITAAQASNVRSAADTVLDRMSNKEQRTYSRAGAIRAAINQQRAGTFQDAEAGFAREVSDDIRKEAGTRGISNIGDGILTPGVLNERFAAMEAQQTRTVLSGSGSIAGATNFVDVQLPPIELLRNRSVSLALGARMVGGLKGTPQFTKQNAAASSSWMAEGVAATTSDPGLTFFQMNPHRLSMGSAYSRDFLALSHLAVDSFLAEDRYAVLALSLDYASLAGSGTNNVPLGLLNQTGLQTVLTGATRSGNTVTAGTGGVPATYIDLNEMEAAIAGTNADTLGDLRWAGTPQTRASLRTIPQFPGAAGYNPIMPSSTVAAGGLQEGPLGYSALFSNQLPKNGTVNSVSNLHALILGNWPQMLIGDWDLNEVIVDNITGAAAAIYKIWEHGYYDVNFRHIEAFVLAWVLAQ